MNWKSTEDMHLVLQAKNGFISNFVSSAGLFYLKLEARQISENSFSVVKFSQNTQR